MSDSLTHTRLDLSTPQGWVLFLAHHVPRRLVIFVHGFQGGAVRSWRDFPMVDQAEDWWQESDLLFVSYPSERENLTASASRLRRVLPDFYPHLPDGTLQISGFSVRPAQAGGYEELILVGHSLGGVVVRRALCDAAEDWLWRRAKGQGADRPTILDAKVRMFSPASAGFRPSGRLGLVRATPFWVVANAYLRRSSAFTDLQPASPVLRETRTRTEALLQGPHGDELGALGAEIVWANPDDVVLSERYTTDRPAVAADGTDHGSVCKPNQGYVLPWAFVKDGCEGI
jgi:pimeloyl-ACP methyl ester carboxylesterase